MKLINYYQLFHGEGRYHTETSPLICGANGFYMITASFMRELKTRAKQRWTIFFQGVPDRARKKIGHKTKVQVSSRHHQVHCCLFFVT